MGSSSEQRLVIEPSPLMTFSWENIMISIMISGDFSVKDPDFLLQFNERLDTIFYIVAGRICEIQRSND